MSLTNAEATVEDLYGVEGKAELVNGEIILMSPTGGLPAYAVREIVSSLREYEKATKSGYAVQDNTGFVVNLPRRKSFSPDAAFYKGKLKMGFLDGAPVFAVEVRSEGDYGARSEKRIREKVADYFAAGTLVVWDVDLLSDDVIKKYDARDPERPIIFRRGETANAEPALKDWKMKVDDLFAD